jgi:hypothetical protein
VFHAHGHRALVLCFTKSGSELLGLVGSAVLFLCLFCEVCFEIVAKKSNQIKIKF